jgi:hypothetical protein
MPERGDGSGLAVNAVDRGETLGFVADAEDVLSEAGGHFREGGAQELFGFVHVDP